MRIPTLKFSAACMVAALGLTACGDGDDTSEGDTPPLTIHASSETSWQRNFNPYSSTSLPGVDSFMYEPLQVSTAMQPGEPIPWLADEMEFNEDGTVVTFTLREDVQWSDGEQFNADDVAFTFELLAEFPALNLLAIPVEGAEAVSDFQVDVTLTETSFARQGDIGNTVVVPEHIWADVEDPVEFTNEEDPTGTGPFVLGDFSEQLYTLEKNHDYWAADEIEVEEVRYPSSTQQTFTTQLQSGEYDWSGGFVANIDEIFVSQDPDNRGYWYAGDGVVNLTLNNEHEIFDDLALREAMSLGINREEVAEIAMQGYVPPAHPTVLPQPTYDEVMAADYQDLAFEYDPDEANAILDDAGYEMGSNGIRSTPNGEELSFELLINSGYPDWIDIAQVVGDQLEDIGIEMIPQGVSGEAYADGRNSGNFDVTITTVQAGLTPYDLYRDLMSSEFAPDEDGQVLSNFSRFQSEEADEALSTFRNTEDEQEQQAALEELQRIAVEQYPVLPLIQSANWFNYNTESWTGFPGDDDPYALGAPYHTPDNLLVMRNLTPTQR